MHEILQLVLDCFRNWNIEPDQEELLKTADAVVTHEIGDQRHVSATTRAIAELGVALAKRHNVPLLCQYPGSQVARDEFDCVPYYAADQHMLELFGYLDTEEVNRQFASQCHDNKWRKVIVVTHPHHLWRAAINLERYELEVLYPDVSSITYDKALWRTRPALATAWLFIPREILARLWYLTKGLL